MTKLFVGRPAEPAGGSRRGRNQSVVALAGILALAVVIAISGCGSSNKASNSGNSTPSSGASTGSSGGAGASKPTGSPIDIMQIADATGQVFPQPALPQTAKAIVASINASGGLGGHPVSLSTCDSQGDPNATAACGRSAVSSHAVAVVGSYEADPAPLLPILTAAKIPYIPDFPEDPTEFNSPISFPPGNSLATLPGTGALAAKYCSSTVTAIPDVAAVPLYAALVNAGLKASGKPATTVVKLPLQPGDFSAEAAQIAGSKAQCLIYQGSQGEELSLFPALVSAGAKQRLVTSTAAIPPSVRSKDPAKLLNGALVADSLPAFVGPEWNPFRAIMAKYSSLAPGVYGYVGPEMVYVDFLVFEKAVKAVLAKHESVTTATLASYLSHDSAVTTNGLLPTFSFTTTSGVKGFPRMFQNSQFYETIKNGNLEPLGGSVSHSMTPYLQDALGKAS